MLGRVRVRVRVRFKVEIKVEVMFGVEPLLPSHPRVNYGLIRARRHKQVSSTFALHLIRVRVATQGLETG